MKLIKAFSLAATAATATMALVGTTPASAETNTQLCNSHSSLTCSKPTTSAHLVLAAGTVLKILSPISVLCLSELWELEPLALSKPQPIHFTTKLALGCGTGSAHNNCSLTTESLPLATLLKTGLDEGSLELLSGNMRLVCSNLGINCVYDLEGTLASVGAQHVTFSEAPVVELGGKFFCPNEGFVDALLETLTSSYVLG